jgi:hypothetical protein
MKKLPSAISMARVLQHGYSSHRSDSLKVTSMFDGYVIREMVATQLAPAVQHHLEYRDAAESFVTLAPRRSVVISGFATEFL